MILSGWLYETARLTALTSIRSEIRRTRREHEAYMQNLSNEAESDAWPQIAPLLDAAMSKLSESDRQAIVLRYFDGKSLKEVGAALGGSDDAAKMRVNRAVEKIRLFFKKRGVVVSAAVLTTAISTNSVQAAPVALANTATALAIGKGVTTAGSAGVLAKSALKAMAWAKTQMTLTFGVAVVMAVGTITVVVKQFNKEEIYPWQIPSVTQDDADRVFKSTPPQAKIVPTKYPERAGLGQMTYSWQGRDYFEIKTLGIAVTPEQLVSDAYHADIFRIAYRTKLPDQKYDFIVNVPRGSLPTLQEELRKTLGLVGRRAMVETNVLLLRLATPTAEAFKPANSLKQSMGLMGVPKSWISETNVLTKSDDGRFWTNTTVWFDQPLGTLETFLQNIFRQLVINGTGLTNRYDFSFSSPIGNNPAVWREALLNQLGIQLVPSREHIEMLVVEHTEKASP